MRAVIQRVSKASVAVGGARIARIGPGFLVLLAAGSGDTEDLARQLAEKVVGLRLFEDEGGRMNLGLQEVDGEVLCVSQFTLYGGVRRGRRPSFANALDPQAAERLYDVFCEAVEATSGTCQRGHFGAHMVVSLVNHGPVTLILDTAELGRPRRA